MSTDAKRQVAGIAFVLLLILSVWWPSPVVSINHLCCNAHLPVDDLSFLGREAPSWDVVFWFLAGLFVLGLVQSGEAPRDEIRAAWTRVRAMRPRFGRGALIASVASALLVALIWRFVDAPVTRWAEGLQSDGVEDFIRILNRLGGGMNPPMIVLFFLVAGLVYGHRRWTDYGASMVLAGAAAGIAAQLVKYLVGRTRPEMWLGPFAHARASATSFPSGHTVGAFALAGVLMFESRSLALRLTAGTLAVLVALSRVLAFRHWTSDVVASACIGLVMAAILHHEDTLPEG